MARTQSSPVRGVHNGVPPFFMASCYEAIQGGTHGYAAAGWRLAASVGTQIPDDVDGLDDWAPEVDELHSALADNDDAAVWSWFKKHYPKCMRLVPVRRRAQFVAGVRGAHEEGRTEL
jgi:hypothetical protein